MDRDIYEYYVLIDGQELKADCYYDDFRDRDSFSCRVNGYVYVNPPYRKEYITTVKDYSLLYLLSIPVVLCITYLLVCFISKINFRRNKKDV